MNKVTFKPRELPYEINEELKQLRTNLQFCGTDKKVILFTSSIASEGKSTTCMEICRSMAELDKTVLLIDCDLRRSMLKHRFVEENHIHYGLSHCLSGQAKLEDVLAETDEEGMYVIFAGHVPPNPSELLASEKMQRILDWGREQFDYVILDCAPLSMVIDAAVVAPFVDGAVVVIEAEHIPYRVVQNVVTQLQSANCTVLGAVLNKVNYRGGRKYYNHYYRKYGYGYGKYGKYYSRYQSSPNRYQYTAEITSDSGSKKRAKKTDA